MARGQAQGMRQRKAVSAGYHVGRPSFAGRCRSPRLCPSRSRCLSSRQAVLQLRKLVAELLVLLSQRSGLALSLRKRFKRSFHCYLLPSILC